MTKKRGVCYHNANLVALGIALVTLLVLVMNSIAEDIITPLINFTYPTPPNGTKKEENYAEIRINTTEEGLNTFVWNWNGTNYTFYDNSLVLMMNFENNPALGESNTHVKDLSKYENDGAIDGATYKEGVYGYGLEFDGNDYVSVSDDNTLDLDVFSLEFWFKPNKDYEEGSDYLSFFYDDDYKIYMENGKIMFDYEGNKISSLTNQWEKDRWYYILVTYDGVQKIYVNDINENSVIVAAPFIVKNNNGENVAFFLNDGDLILKGDCNAGSCSYPGDDAFIIQNSKSETVAYINSIGDLCIEDSNCNDKDANCNNPSDGSFIVKGANDEIVSYINSDGELCLIGDLIEKGIQ